MSAGTLNCSTKRWSTWRGQNPCEATWTTPSGENCRPTMDFRLSGHAEWEMTRRGIPLAQVQAVMDQPEQRLVDDSATGRWIYQSRLRTEDGKMYLLRVVVDEDEQPPAIITVYRTSKIEKYWSAE